ncbi:hypothetical protein KW516_18790 [Vibrio fluvialis]|nr:hypothetical protein [Vibrio fluvialis]
MLIVPRKLKEPSERVKVTLSPANYTNNDKGEIVLKNSPRLRLMIDKGLLEEQGFICDRLELVRFDDARFFMVFKVTDKGTRATPIKNRSGKADYSVPLSKLTKLKFEDFPELKKAPCAYRVIAREEIFIVALPVERGDV